MYLSYREDGSYGVMMFSECVTLMFYAVSACTLYCLVRKLWDFSICTSGIFIIKCVVKCCFQVCNTLLFYLFMFYFPLSDHKVEFYLKPNQLHCEKSPLSKFSTE